MNYQQIKQLASANGLRVTDLLAMAPKNDPIYVGTPTSIEDANWFKQLWEAAGYSHGVHLRRAHYWAVSRNFKLPRPIKQGKVRSQEYLNTTAAWQFLCQASKYARWLGLVEISSIVDNKNPDPIIYFDGSLFYDYGYKEEISIHVGSFQYPSISSSFPYSGDVQPFLLEVWVEKSTMNDAISRSIHKYRANLVTFQGEASITACNDLIERIDKYNKPTRIFYISDFDPAGNSMPKAVARKVEVLLERKNLSYADVKLKAIALTADQVKQFQLPRSPIKDGEARKDSFEDSFGEGAVELDALEALYPGELDRIVAAELSHYYDQDKADERTERRDKLHANARIWVDRVVRRYKDEIAALDKLQADLQRLAEHYPAHAFHVEPSEHYPLEDDDSFLFDNSRSYVEQIRFYKEHAGKESPLNGQLIEPFL